MDPQHPVTPAEVEFENALDRLVYVQTISIRNYSDRARRVRIDGPAQSGPFSLVFAPQGTLAPGLDCSADVQFVLPDPDKAPPSALETGVSARRRPFPGSRRRDPHRPSTHRAPAAAATRIAHGSRHRRGRDAESQRTGRSDAAAATWSVRAAGTATASWSTSATARNESKCLSGQ